MPATTATAHGQTRTGINSPFQVATVITTKATAPLVIGTDSKRCHRRKVGTRSNSLLPTNDDEKKSLTVGRYQFRKDGVGWECREIIGKGASRKRTYLAHLSRTKYQAMQRACKTTSELQDTLIAWAEEQKRTKRVELKLNRV